MSREDVRPAGPALGRRHRHAPTAQRLRRFEGAVDYIVIGGALILAAAMVWGLLTASGDAPWFQAQG